MARHPDRAKGQGPRYTDEEVRRFEWNFGDAGTRMDILIEVTRLRGYPVNILREEVAEDEPQPNAADVRQQTMVL